MYNVNLKLISQSDILNSGINYSEICNVIEMALLKHKAGKILLPDKISQIFDPTTQNRINCMPSTLLEDLICGVKWVSVFPNNPDKFNIPNVSGVIILSEIEKGYPFAIMDGTYITALRTACLGAIGAKYLARRDSTSVGLIGSGIQAQTHFEVIKYLMPQINTCYVASRKLSSEQKCIEKLKEKYPEVSYISCDSNYQKASKDSDIIVTAVSCQQPLLKADYIKEGAFYCHVGGWEDEYDVPLMADKIVCDDWEALKHRGSPTIARLFEKGELKDDDIYCNLADIIDGTKVGRETNTEFNYFNAIGLSYIDISVAYHIYKKMENTNSLSNWNLL